jgi:hypothetical protein
MAKGANRGLVIPQRCYEVWLWSSESQMGTLLIVSGIGEEVLPPEWFR